MRWGEDEDEDEDEDEVRMGVRRVQQTADCLIHYLRIVPIKSMGGLDDWQFN